MKRTTIFMPETLERDIQLYAKREGLPMAAVVREAVAVYIATKQPSGVVPTFAGIGASGRSGIAEKHEAMLFRDLDPHGGGGAARAFPYRISKRAPRPRRRAR